ncbi:MAG: hypothetical protein ACLR0U_33080 [Enterocloster clostridioformis]
MHDRLIEENDFGRFANSFLMIASRGGGQEKTIFAKYNRTRKEEFRILHPAIAGSGRRAPVGAAPL